MLINTFKPYFPIPNNSKDNNMLNFIKDTLERVLIIFLKGLRYTLIGFLFIYQNLKKLGKSKLGKSK